MKKSIVCLLALAATVTLSTAAFAERGMRNGGGAPPPRHAEFGEPYFFGHVGLFSPNSDSNGLDGFDSGYNVDLGVGSRVNENIAIEGGIGRYWASGPYSVDVSVIPLTFGARLILPQPFVEPYIGGGLGFYHANVDSRYYGSDSDTVVGGYLSLGADAWLNPKTALNFEGRYHIADPKIGGQDISVAGWTMSLGLRVGF